MNETVSRRALIGALGASALLPSLAGARTFPPASIPAGSRELWSWVRAQLVLDPAVGWLDTAGSGPTLRAVMVREYRSRERQSQDFRRYQASVLGADAMVRHLGGVAGFLGAELDEIAFTTGSVDALALLARGLDLQAGDEILASGHERAVALSPWRIEATRRGLRVVELPPDGVPQTPEAIVGRYAGAITPRTKVVILSHVQATDGTVMPVRDICALARANGIVSIVDGALAPGHVDVRIADLGCDAYATAFHRWLNASWGIGALFVRRDLQPRLWATSDVANGLPGAQGRYGISYRHLGPAIEGVGVALEFQQAVNRARIGARIRELAAYLRLQLAPLAGLEILTPSHAALSDGIVSVRLPARDHAAVARSIAEEDGLVLAHVAQGAFDALRISVHPGNDFAQLDRCANALRRHL
jgi:selenocysteine lyase/cysteine desulfurase